MKRIILSVIRIYQIFFSSFIKQGLGIKSSCRFTPTCSEYAKNQILKNGIFKGTYFSILRIFKCQPFYSF